MHRILFTRILLLLAAALLYQSLQAQYYFDKLTEENGLSDNRVTCFLKDKTGFLWIGTKNGLNRYDGNSFKVFKPASGNSISNEAINDVVQDSAGKIWVATMAGLNIYDPETNHWETIMPSGSKAKGDLPSYLIWDLFVDETNRIWIVSDVWELSVYDPVTKKYTYYDWPSVWPQYEKIGYRSIQKIVRKNETEWWLATTLGLFSLDTRSKQFTFLGSGYTGSVKDLKYDKLHNTVFLISEHGNLFSFDANKNVYKENKITYQVFPAVVWNRKKETNNLLLMAHTGGMMEINTTTGEATVISHLPSLSSSLLPGETTNIYTDNSGIVWVGTGNGINYYNSRNRIADFISLESVSSKESTDGMSAAIYDSIDRRYFITSIRSKKVYIIDDRTGLIRAIESAGGKPFSECLNVCLDRQNTIWLLTKNDIYRYDRLQEQFILFPTPHPIEEMAFTDMLQDKTGDYWFSSWGAGVYRYKVKEKLFQRFTEKDNVYSNTITSLTNDPIDNMVWIGTFNAGIYRYDGQKDSVTVFTETDANADYMQMNLIKDIEADEAGKMWFTTFGSGLYMYRRGKSYERSFTHFTAKNGLSNSSYFSIAADNKNRLWLLSGEGVSAIDSSGKFLYEVSKHPAIGFANYAPDDSYPKRIFYNKLNNELLIPVAGGLLLYYPDKKIPAIGFPVALTDISVNGHSVMYDSVYTSRNNIEIPYSSNSLSFHFAALTYASQEKIYYEYKLHKNEQWKSLGASNTVNFPDLSPGYYTLQVRAKDARSHLSVNTVSFSFRIIPPFWKTWWFIMLLVLLFGYIFYRWIVYLRHKIKAQKILNYFATSLYGQNTVEDICWDVAKNCMSELKLTDCVIYLYDPQRKVLMQKAAYGSKNPEKHEIVNAIEIPLGTGIVGTVAKTGRAEIIHDTSKDSRYIMDDEKRYSEITVPIFVDGRIFGIIDSENSRKNFYRKHHLRILKDIAVICADKISKYIIEERLRTKISRDLHDEIGSALTSINIISKVALSKAGSDTEVSNYLLKIKDSTFETMESMSDIVWAINPKNDKLESLMSRMKEFAADICEAKGIDLSFKLPEELEKLPVDLGTRKNLFLVFKEAVNNAAKYSGCTLLRVQFERKDDQLKMEIQDNGKGFDITTVVRGNGLYNMQERAAECNGSLQIRSSAQEGTNLVLQVPITRFGVSLNS